MEQARTDDTFSLVLSALCSGRKSVDVTLAMSVGKVRPGKTRRGRRRLTVPAATVATHTAHTTTPTWGGAEEEEEDEQQQEEEEEDEQQQEEQEVVDVVVEEQVPADLAAPVGLPQAREDQQQGGEGRVDLTPFFDPPIQGPVPVLQQLQDAKGWGAWDCALSHIMSLEEVPRAFGKAWSTVLVTVLGSVIQGPSSGIPRAFPAQGTIEVLWL